MTEQALTADGRDGAGRGSSATPEPARSRPPRSEKRARSQLVNVRINDDERERWTALAQRKGLSLGGLLRLSVEAALLEEQMLEAMR